jgi:hypothetical protein
MEHVFLAYLSFCQTAVDSMEQDMLTMSGQELEDAADGIYQIRAHMAFTKQFLKAMQNG